MQPDERPPDDDSGEESPKEDEEARQSWKKASVEKKQKGSKGGTPTHHEPLSEVSNQPQKLLQLPTLPVSTGGIKELHEQMGASEDVQEPQLGQPPEEAEHSAGKRQLPESTYTLVGKLASFLQFLADYNAGKCMREISK